MTSWGDEADLRNWLVDYLVTNIGGNPEQIDLDAPLNELGLGSHDTVVLARELSDILGRPVSPVDFWENPTINALAHGLLHPDPEPTPGGVAGVGGRGSPDEPIAVIGLGCRLPDDIHGPDAFWQFLAEGRSAVGQVPDERWQVFDDGSADFGAALARTTRWGSFLDDVAAFDAEFFDISPGEADRIDPQQRLLLEVAIEALDHAGIPPESLRRTQTGVFAGACLSEYGVLASRDLDRIDVWTGTGGALSIIANRLSYFLDLRGPSFTVDTACSSSLVAIHLACKSVRTGESDLALAAGVNLVLSPTVTRSLDAAGAMSQSGACRAFDAGADGYVRGEGCGVVVLKRLSEALRDGDKVLAVVRGSAINQDGRSNGLMAPNPSAQTAVLRAACADAGVEPREVDYVEAHGTGTLLGDPIEARGLGSVYGRGRGPNSPLLIGSVKTNVGHLEAAAGVTGFIKATLAVQRGRIPANLHFDSPNPHIPFEELGLRVVNDPTNWPSTGRPRRAAVSSFGFGGTNAHLVLEQPPAAISSRLRPADSPVTTLVVAGKTPKRVASWASALADWMDGAGAVVPLPDIAHTVNHHRSRQGSFATVAARTREQAVAGLRALAAGQSGLGVVESHGGRCSSGVVFVYSGQGSQWAGMGRQLLADEPAFAAAIDELEPEFVAQTGFSLKRVIADGEPLVGIDRIQPVLVAVQLALTSLWRSYGIQPDALIGHSMGEITAAVVSGALSVADGLRVVATRSRLMARLSGQGAMALLELDPQAAEELAASDEELTVAVYASPRQSVIAGPPAKIDSLITELQGMDRLAQLIDVDVASHHPTVDPLLPDLRAQLPDLVPGFAAIPVITTTSGRQGTATFDADYWADNLRNPVRFTQAVTDVAQRHGIFIEVSPHPLLTYAIDDTISPTHHHSIPTLQRGADDTLTFHTNLNASHTTHPPQTPHLPEPHPPLPSAPWLHAYHWISTKPRPSQDDSHADPRRFVHRIAWSPRPADELSVPPAGATVAVVGPAEDTNARVRELLGERGFHAGSPTDARYVIYVAGDEPVVRSESDCDATVRISDEVTKLVRQLTDRHDQHPARLWILTRGVLESVDSSVLPQSCLWGLASVIAAEEPQTWGGLVDLPAAVDPEEWLPVLAEQLSTPSRSVLVLRDGEVRAPELVPVDGQPVRPALRCRPDAAYLITGGLGALGLLTANWLADRGARRLILAGRTALPPRRQWETVTDPVTAGRIAAIRTLEARGVAVEAVALDVAAPHSVHDLLDRRDADGAPPIRGVVHAAGVIRDQLLTRLDLDALREVMSPKVAGAQALDMAFPPESVDFFFLISSAAAVSGVPGQGSYAAANAYLDALARSRHRRGGHTLSIDWVVWRGLGLGADAPLVVAELERQGSRPVEPEEAFEAWEHVAAYDVAQAVVIPVADGKLPTDVDGWPASAPARDWSQLSAAEVYRELAAGLIDFLTRELRIGEDELPVDVPFTELGLDSLWAMSIRREAEHLVGVELSMSILWDHPTVAALAAYLTDKVTSQADAVFDAPSVGRSSLRVGGARSRRSPLVARERPAVIPLSFAQSRLWFLDRFEGGVATYNIPTAVRVTGPLDVDALAGALDDVIARHESLRTIFPDVDGVPFQQVVPAQAGMWRRGGAAVISVPEQDVAGEVAALAGYRFDLSAEIPIRAQIYSLGPEQYVVGIVVHHIAFDGWSIAPMARDVGEAYRARRQGRAPQWASLPVQYVDYTLWQRELLGQEPEPDSVIAGQLRYWRDELAGLPEVVSLLPDRARPPVLSYRGDAVDVRIDPQVWAGVKQLAAAHNATVSMVLQAAMAVLLHRVGAGEDIVVGSPIAGRLDEALDDLIGFCVNTWVLRVGVNSGQRFSDVLAQVRRKALNAYGNQDVPFERLVEQLNPVRSTAHHPLFQVSLAFQNAVRLEVALDGVSVEQIAVSTDTAKFDLDFQLLEVLTDGGAAPMAAGTVSYATDLFDRATIERLVGWFGRVIEAVVVDASVVVGEVPLLDRRQRDFLVYGCNDTDAPVPATEEFIHNRFVEQAKRRPEATALVTVDGPVHYGELLSRANRLATHLRELGVRRGTLVAVCMERSADMVVALLAILRAGAAYLPLDPEYPAHQLAYMVDDARPQALVTGRGCPATMPLGDVPTVRIDTDWPAIAVLVELDAAVPVDGSDLAYVIYTSGSTGRPKGAMNTHAGIANRLMWMQSAYGLTESDRVLHKTPSSFDVSITELFWPLMTGATMVIAQPGGNRMPDYLVELMRTERVTTAHFVPSMLRALLKQPTVGECVHLRRVIASGEELAPDVVADFHRQLGAELHNLYGPTEAAVDVTAWTCERDPGLTRIPIGHPIANTAIHVLDESLEPAPPGVPGELYIGGIGVGRGYLVRPGLTAERFVADPFATVPGGRLYRTGDRARRRADGVIEFLGRLDAQTKVRGMRIEPEEIEVALRAHAAVQDAAVAAHTYDEGDTRLIAYVVPDPKEAPVIARLAARQRDGSLEGHTLIDLANGLTIAAGGRAEVEFMYSEIFEEQVYLRHGITLPPGACVFDVGANIGLFDLFVSGRVDDARVYAFEPIPQVHERLAINLDLHAPTARAVNRGLASKAGPAKFTYYPYLSILSGRYADAREDARAVLAYEQHRARHDGDERDALEEVITNRLSSRTVVCELTTLSDAIAEYDVAQIDLLKIDAEKSEQDVLQGIEPDDWPRIRQIVMEVHDSGDRIARTRTLLEDNGYRVTLEQQDSLGASGPVLIYARRSHEASTAPTEQTPAPVSAVSFGSPDTVRGALRDHAAKRLPGHMVPADVVFLDTLPRTPNGKLDRRALPAPQTLALASAPACFVAPRTPLETQLAHLFADVLHRESIGVHDDFFALGGDSLLATRVCARLQLALGVEVPVRYLFDASTVGGLADYLHRHRGGPARPPLRVMPRPERVPLSFAQSRLWFLNRFEGGAATYNIPTAFRISGTLDVEALGAALDDVIARHESLRTIFPDIDGVPFQKVLPAEAGMWRRGGAAVVSVPEPDVIGELAGLAGYRFDLSTEIPIRAQIYSVGPEQHVVGIVVHHIAFDGWSMAPMVRDVGAAYASRCAGRAPEWAPLAVQYVDYTLWQQDWLGSESDPDSVIASQLAYWRQQLAGLPEVVSLPTDRPRPPVPSYRGDWVQMCIDPPVWAGVKALAAAHNATTSMVLQAVMAVVLHRAGVGEDVAMGTPIAGRLDQALDELVGFFVNTWVLRVGVNSGQRFSDVLEHVRQNSRDAYGNQDVPFELLVEQLNPTRSASHHPLFQVGMVFQNNVRPEVTLGGVSVEPLVVSTRTAKWDLDFDLTEVRGDEAGAPMATGLVTYATDLFDRATIERLVGWFGRVIDAVVADASVVIGDVSLLYHGERDLVLSALAGAGVQAPVGVAPQLLAAAVAADPDAAAVVDGARAVSYRELDEWSTRLARVLIEAGVGPERAVGVAMDRCVELVVAWWAVVKAGGVYVPVDRAHPVERIATMLDAVDAVCVLTGGADTVAGADSRPVVRIDGLDLSGRSAETISDADRLAAPGVDDAAYVIFTSGSTGVPKGVAVSHAGLLGLAAAQREVFGLGADARVSMVAAPTFDASVFELVLAAGSGAALVVASPDEYAGEALTAVLQGQQVSAAVLTPTVLSSLDRTRLDGLDTLITAGEACPGEVVADWAPGRRMFNAYGPTETTIWASCTEPLAAGQPVGIGAPIPGVCALVLDARLNPAPVGVVGELYLSGPALARGYVGRAELTAERFVANPYGGAGARMYRTGDLARWTSAGSLEYLGRADTQIKLRGQRIELGEIENTLLACAQVTQAAAAVHHTDAGSHLVAYITLEHTTTADSAVQDAEIVEEWQHMYDELYGAEVGESGFGMDFRGWNSSYTDDPIPLEEMVEWRSATVDRITALQPRRVLEIGVGSGLLLAHVAPACVEYWGTDFSAPTIQKLRAAVASQSWGDRVQLRVQPAAVADGLPEGHFDVVVLNSVVQYFPSPGYLLEVLAVAVRSLAPGGALFIGDVRNHTLQGAFQTAAALARTTTTDTAEIRQRVQRAMLSEPELLLAPEFFTTWAADYPAVAGLDIEVKRGLADNELNRYRYDVTIHKTPTPVRSLATAPTWTWTQCAGLRGLHTQLISQRPAAVRITEIPRAGLITDVHIEQALATGLPVADALAQATDTATPEELHRLGEITGYHVAVTWGAQPGTLDAVFLTPAEPDPEHIAPLTDLYLPPVGAHQRTTHANDPHTNSKIGAVRQWLGARLPDYMVPAQIVVLDEFPLTSSGKIDRKALPAPVFGATAFRAPQTQTEEILAGIYARVLGLDRVGVDDSFFDLGGDSLSAMRVIAAINTSLDSQLPVRTLFEAPSVGGLSQQLRRPASPVEIAPVETLKHGTGVPLFCFHPAGGLAWPYQPLGNYLDCPIIGIQQAHGEEAAPESIRAMAKTYADRLQTVEPIGPYNLLGWSLGGVIAHEVAIELCRRGCVVGRLILLDALPWGDINLTREQVSDTVVESYVLELMLGYLRIDIPEQSEPVTYQQAEELIHHQIPLPIAQLRVFLKFFAQNINDSFSYQLEHVPGVFDGDMVVFSTTQNEYDWDLPLHWRSYVTGDITEYPVDCLHLEMLSPESIMMYGKQLKLLFEPTSSDGL